MSEQDIMQLKAIRGKINSAINGLEKGVWIPDVISLLNDAVELTVDFFNPKVSQ